MTNDLDIEINQIDLSDPIDAHSKIAGIVNRWHLDDQNRKVARAASWQQSVNFLVGNQWLQYNQTTRHYETIPYTDANKNIDRPVTNHTLRWVVTVLSGFTSKPETIIDPNSDEPQDKTAAAVAEVVGDYLWVELDKDESYYEAAMNGVCYGVAFRKSFKRPTLKYLDREVPELGPDKQPLPPNPDGTARLVKEKDYLKCPDVEIVPPFNIAFDGSPKRWRDVAIIMETSVRRLSWIVEHYGIDAPGFTGKAGAVTAEEIASNPVNIGEGLKNLVEGQRSGYSNGKGADEMKGCAVVKELYIEPSKQFPQGRMIVCAGEYTLYDSALTPENKSPYYYLEGRIWHPYTFWRYWPQPGSIWALGLVQQLVPIQRRINAIDALLAYNRKTVAVGHWLIPSGAGISDESIIGVPGQHVTYDPDISGAKPELIPGQPLPQQIVQEREMLLAEGSQIASSADIRGGQNPTGVNTLGQLQILTEQADMSRSKQIASWERFIEESEQLDLLNFQDCYRAPQPEVYQKLRKFGKDLSDMDWTTFMGQDIQDNSNVRVERGSTIAKSRIMRQNIILKLAQMGLLGEIVGDPFAHKLFLEEFGLTKLFNEGSIDMKKAEKCIEMMLAGEYPPVLEEIDNPDVQLMVLARYMKDAKFLTLPEEIKNLFFKRYEAYIQMLAQANAVPDNAPEAGTEQGAEGQQPGMKGAGKPGIGETQDLMA